MVVSIVLGFVVPMIVSYLKNVNWHKGIRIALAGVVSVVVAIAGLLAQGDLSSLQDVLTHGAIVWAAATANYRLWFGDTDLNVKLEGVGVHGGDTP